MLFVVIFFVMCISMIASSFLFWETGSGIALIFCFSAMLGMLSSKAALAESVRDDNIKKIQEALRDGKNLYLNGEPVPEDFDINGFDLYHYKIEVNDDKVFLRREYDKWN